MNYLELVKRLASETGTELESKVTTVEVPPATAYGETTEHRTRLINWVRQAWIEIQEDQDQWNFMVRRASMPLVRGQTSYAIAELAEPDCNGCLPEECDPDEAFYDYIVPFVAPQDYRYIWMVDGSTQQPNPQICYYVHPERFFGDRDRMNKTAFGQPSRYSIDRTGCIVFDASPSDDDYHIQFEYKLLPHEFLTDEDTPRGLPLKYHMLIIYKAMVYYAMFDEADKQVQRAAKLARDWMNKLRRDQLKEYTMPGTRS